MEEKYIPLDDRWIRIGENAYKLPWEKLTKEEKKRKLIWEKNLKIYKENKNIMDCMDVNVEINSATVIIQKCFSRRLLIKNVKKMLRLSVNEIKKSKEFNDLNIIGLLIMKILEKKGINKKNQSRKGVHKLIDSKKRGIINKEKKNGKSLNKKNEDIRNCWICEQINIPTELGKLMKYKYHEKTGLEILRVEKKGGNNEHYDILIYHTDGTFARCEEKGTIKYHEIIDDTTKPYENSVEFYNGPAEKFSIALKYLKLWYNINVINAEITSKYNLPPPPSFEEWLTGGPYCMVDPISDYSKTLKINYRNIYPGKSMNSWGHDEIDYRENPNNAFDITDEEKTILINEVQNIYNDVMNEKDVWLQTTGTVDGNFSFKWFNKIEPKKIVGVDLLKKKDIEFKFNFEDNTYITGIMRWGKGCGFSCFRMDLK
jgi:hypothetical protein